MKATGVPVPDEIIDELGGSKRPAVSVALGEYRYRTTVGRMGGRYIFPLSAEHRAASGLSAGDPVEVTIELDVEARTTELPADLAAALDAAGLRSAFDALAPSRQKAHVTNVEGTKNSDTRARRVVGVVTALSAG